MEEHILICWVASSEYSVSADKGSAVTQIDGFTSKFSCEAALEDVYQASAHTIRGVCVPIHYTDDERAARIKEKQDGKI